MLFRSSIDASEIFIFLNFGISGQMLGGDDIESNTISKIEKELFNGNMLPIRFKDYREKELAIYSSRRD